MHVMTIGFPGLPKLRQLHPFLWVERMMVPMPRIRSEFSGLVGLTQSWAAATLGALFHRARKQDFDVVHAHLDGQIPALLVAWLAPRLLRRPLIVTVHCSSLAVYTPNSRLDMLQHRLAQWLERRTIAEAFAVMALTQRTATVLVIEVVDGFRTELAGLARRRGVHTVAFHPPCTLQHGLQIRGRVERLLGALGIEVRLPMDSHLCCGSAGTYSILQPALAYELRDRKLESLAALEPQMIVSANVGCIAHLQSGTSTPVAHWIELVEHSVFG